MNLFFVILVLYSYQSLVHSVGIDLNKHPIEYQDDLDRNDMEINLNVVPEEDHDDLDRMRPNQENEGNQENERNQENQRNDMEINLNVVPEEYHDDNLVSEKNGFGKFPVEIDLNDLPVESEPNDTDQTISENNNENSLTESVENPRLEQVKREGKAFVEEKLEEFKSIDVKTTLLIPHLNSFNDYIKNVVNKDVITRLREMIKRNLEYNQEFEVISNELHESIVMLEYAQEWIHKRIDSISQVILKQGFTIIQTDLSNTIEFYQNILKLLTELKGSNDVQNLLKKIELKITPEVWEKKYVKNESVNLVFKKIQKIINLYKFVESVSVSIFI